MTEQGLIIQAQQGDTAAFEALVDQNAQYVYNLAVRVVKNPQDAEEIAQEAFIRAWRALPKFRAQSSFRTWLYRIVTNLCYDSLPKIKRQLADLDPDEAPHLPDQRRQPEEALLSKELQAHLRRAIEELPESYRLLITLRHLQQMSYQEIAEVTGQPLGTVKTGIYRGRKILVKWIQDHDG